KMDPLEYQTELERLRPHMDTLMTILSQTRGKTRAMKEGDPRLPTYKGVIHQLCRVLVLLHKKDPVGNLPSDALSLVQWGHQMVEDSRQQEASLSDTAVDFPIAQISSVDMDYPHPMSPVYATPDGSTDQGFPLPTLSQATPYSSVPVPCTPIHQDVSDPVAKSGFATISRTPSIPNGVIVKSLDEDPGRESQWNNTGANSDEENKFNTFGRRNKLVQRHFEDSVGTGTPVLRGHNPASLPRPVSTPNFGRGLEQYFQAGSSADSPVDQKTNFAAGKRPISQTYSIPHKQHPSQPSKKNIITNPKAVKGSPSFSTAASLGAVGKKSKQAVPLTNKGYFANGHFYDPNPMPVDVVDGEVYAPGSNYSDHSNIMSTFLGELPRSRTPSSSNNSEDGDESENSGGDLDVFPFDPNDVTDPVEV
ncbi:hypothetical protein EGW08_012408, partial [Elysia chlorotica]